MNIKWDRTIMLYGILYLRTSILCVGHAATAAVCVCILLSIIRFLWELATCIYFWWSIVAWPLHTFPLHTLNHLGVRTSVAHSGDSLYTCHYLLAIYVRVGMCNVPIADYKLDIEKYVASLLSGYKLTSDFVGKFSWGWPRLDFPTLFLYIERSNQVVWTTSGPA